MLPARMDVGQKPQVLRGMDRRNRTHAMVGRFDHCEAGVGSAFQQRVDPLRRFGVGLAGPAGKKKLRIVIFLRGVIDDLHDGKRSPVGIFGFAEATIRQSSAEFRNPRDR